MDTKKDTNEHLQNIKKMYDKLTYYDHYGGTLILFIVITIVVLLLVSYFQMMINVQPIIDNWPNERCKPGIIPFAGFITRPDGVSATDYTAENFTYCTQEILKSTTGTALQPLTFVTQFLQSFAEAIQKSIQAVRGMFDKVRTSMQKVSEEMMGRLMNIMIPLLQMIISFKDFGGKLQGTMTAGLYTLLGSYFTLKSLMGAIAEFIIIILITLAGLIAGLWVLPMTWGVAIANTAIFIAIAIPMAIILAFMDKTLKVSGNYKIPSVKCFDKNTLLKMNDGSYKSIMEVCVGDILEDNNTIVSKIKVTRKNSTMYKLHDIIVSDSHIVNYNNIWMKVRQHPQAIILDQDNYCEPYLYCLNTTQKTIKINDILFADWDDLYNQLLEKVLFCLRSSQINIQNKTELCKYIHCGFSRETQVVLRNGKIIDIQNVKVGDMLSNGENVYGIVEIDGNKLENQYHYYLGNDMFIQGYDINLKAKKTKIYKKDKLYNLLTNTGSFYIQPSLKYNRMLQFKDYNYSVDNFLLI
jgi:hypothetical protein